MFIDDDDNRWFQPYSYPGLEVDINKFRKNTNITEIEPGELFTLRVNAQQLMIEDSIEPEGLNAYCTWLNTIKAGGYDDWRPLTLLEIIHVNQLEGQAIIWKEGDYSDSSYSYFDTVNGFKSLGFRNFHPRIGRGPSNIVNW